jgi:peptidoglycan hydrolase-like protein with peptidoglycan-binding domain
LGLNQGGLMGGPTTVTPAAANPPAPSATKPPGALQVTDRGGAVKVLQNLLVVNGVGCDADGIFGQRTATAVRTFQGKAGIAATGVADIPTQVWLARGLPGTRKLAVGLRGDDVAAFQRILGLHRISVGTDGAFGQATQAAVQIFQRKHGLSPSGVVDATTRRASWQ